MNWHALTKDMWVSEPYQVIRDINGWSAWIYAEDRSGNLGRSMSLNEAKSICEQEARDHALLQTKA